MNTKELEINLHKFIDEIEDNEFLEDIFSFIKSKNGFYELPDYLKKELEISLQQANNGEVISHEEAMKKIYDKVSNL